LTVLDNNWPHWYGKCQRQWKGRNSSNDGQMLSDHPVQNFQN
jgi:hypothetical protein